MFVAAFELFERCKCSCNAHGIDNDDDDDDVVEPDRTNACVNQHHTIEQDFTLDFYFRQFWTDPRLAYQKRPGVETLSVGSDFIKNIWVPDTFFVNEKQSYFHFATTSNEFIRVHHSGSITRSIR